MNNDNNQLIKVNGKKMYLKWLFFLLSLIILCIIAFILCHEKGFAISGLLIGFFGFGATIYTLQKGNIIRESEFIERLCGVFERPNISKLYYKIEYNHLDPILDESEDEKDLDELISFFDSMEYYHRKKIISDDEVEFVAVELLTVYENKVVRQYIKKVQKYFKKYQHENYPINWFSRFS